MLNSLTKFHSHLNKIRLLKPKILPTTGSCRPLSFSGSILTNNSFEPKFSIGQWHIFVNKVNYSTNGSIPQNANAIELSELDFEKYCTETLESLSDYFDEILENSNHLSEADITNSDGVLTINLGKQLGTYVINKQTPNKQIWLSSPRSGPKRFDFIFASSKSTSADDDHAAGYWYYKHERVTLHDLLDKEFSDITKSPTKFRKLPFGSQR